MPHHHPDEGGICFTSESHNTNNESHNSTTESHSHTSEKGQNSKDNCPAENVYLVNSQSEIKFTDIVTLNNSIPGFINYCLATHLLTDQLLLTDKISTTKKDYHNLYQSVYLYQSNSLRAPPFLYS